MRPLCGHADGPRQIIGPAPDWSMSFIDVSAAADPQAAAEQWMKADLAKPIDLTHGPLFDFRALQGGARPFLLVFALPSHRDGRFQLRARCATRGGRLHRARSRTDRRHQHLWLAGSDCWRDDAAYRASKRFEQDRRILDGLPRRPAGAGKPGRACAAEVPRLYSSHRLAAVFDHRCNCSSIAQRTGASLPQLITAAAAIFVHRLTGTQDVVLDVPLTARMTPLARCTPGMMSNVLPVRLAVRPDMHRIRAGRRDRAADAPGVSTPTLQRRESATGYRASGADQRAFGPTVNVMPFDYDLRFDGHPATAHNLTDGPVEDLSIVLYDRSDSRELRIDFNGNPASYSADKLAGSATTVSQTSGCASRIPTSRIGSLDILSPDERRTILHGLERHRACDPVRHLAGAVRGAGGE